MAVPLPAAAGVEGTRESRDLSLPPWSGKTIDRSVTKLSDGQKKVSERKVPEPPEAGQKINKKSTEHRDYLASGAQGDDREGVRAVAV